MIARFMSFCKPGVTIMWVLQTFKLSFLIEATATNNLAEYQALLKGIWLLQEIGADAVEIFGDSMLVVNQLIGIYECKDDILRVYHEKC